MRAHLGVTETEEVLLVGGTSYDVHLLYLSFQHGEEAVEQASNCFSNYTTGNHDLRMIAALTTLRCEGARSNGCSGLKC